MTAKILVRANEFGTVRVFLLDEALSRSLEASGNSEALSSAFGVAQMNGADVQIVDLEAIREMGLTEFLKSGYDIDPAEIDPSRTRLDATEGTVAVIRSSAFGGVETTLTPGDQVNLIGTFHEQSAAPASFTELNELRTDSAKGQLNTAAGPSTPAPRSRARTWLLAILVAFVLAIFVFIIRLIFGN